MTLRLVELEVDPRLLLQGAGKKLNERAVDPGYHVHAWLSQTFGPGTLQPFRWLEDDLRSRSSRLLAYTRATEQELRDHLALYATPLSEAAIGTLRTKPLPERWRDGMRVGFALRVTPTVRVASDVEGRARRGGEVDAYNAARWRGEDLSRAEVYRRWTAEQLARHGDTELVDFELQRHHLTRVLRRQQQAGRKPAVLTVPDIEAIGTLVIRNGERFTDLLTRGVGRHRAFGFGMVLLRPPRC